MADATVVNFAANGIEFTFNKRHDFSYIWTGAYLFFGKVDVVMKAAPGTGIISSAVLMSDDLDEIDWEFSGNNFAAGHGQVQTNYFGKGIVLGYDRGTMPAIADPTADFHTYTLDWSPTQLVWSVDGSVIRTLKASDCDQSSHQYPQTPARLHLGLWGAGDPSEAGGTVFWAGGYTNFTQAPFTMYVKSVKIQNANPGPYYNWTDQTGNWQSIKVVQNPGSSSSSTASSVTTSSASKTLGPNDYVGTAVPTKVQNGDSQRCNAWYKVSSGDSCYSIAGNHGISLSDFYAWNPTVGNDCGNLWLNYYECVGIDKFNHRQLNHIVNDDVLYYVFSGDENGDERVCNVLTNFFKDIYVGFKHR